MQKKYAKQPTDKALQSVAERALETVAMRYGVEVEEVAREIGAAIVAAREDTDPRAQAFWDSVPSRGEVPTPEEIIAYIALMGRGVMH